ncbi:endonuclease toxin domain-containing protein [Pseudomonas graminis]
MKTMAGPESATLRAPLVRQIDTGIEWEGGIQGQGMPWEDYVGKDLPADARLPKNFETFDYYDEGTKQAISAKTLNTATAAKISNPKQIYYSMKKYIDDAANFKEGKLQNKQVLAEDIKSREVSFAIPKATTDAQWIEINRAVQYGKSNDVNVKITVVK